MVNIAIIGGGNMGEALIKGLQKSKLFVCESNPDRVRYLKKKYEITAAGIADAVAASAIIIFAVKPQDMEPVLMEMKRHLPSPENKLFISIAAGLTTSFFEKRLGKGARVVRTMPNMPALIGEGMTGICTGKYARPIDLKSAREIFTTIGKTLVVEESKMDAVTAVSGSGPAYVFLFAEQWIAAAKDLGLKEEDARLLVGSTLAASSVYLTTETKSTAADLRAKVTSKGGTTQAAMDVFSKGKFGQLIMKALKAAKKRAGELAK